MTRQTARTTPGGVETVERALSLLAAFPENGDGLTLQQLSNRSGLHKSTVLRLAGSLERHGFLERAADGQFTLGPMLWRLGAIYRRGFDLGKLVPPILKRLEDHTHESAAFYVRAEDRRLCLFRVNSRRAARHHVEEGQTLPLDKGAGGLVLTAFGSDPDERSAAIRRDGYAIAVGERDPDVAGIAAPVFCAEGNVAGALIVSGLSTRFTDETIARYVPAVVTAAAELSSTLGGTESLAGSEGGFSDSIGP